MVPISKNAKPKLQNSSQIGTLNGVESWKRVIYEAININVIIRPKTRKLTRNLARVTFLLRKGFTRIGYINAMPIASVMTVLSPRDKIQKSFGGDWYKFVIMCNRIIFLFGLSCWWIGAAYLQKEEWFALLRLVPLILWALPFKLPFSL